jgi:hypothetical protein
VRSTTFLFTTWCTSIQIFGVLGVQIGVQCHKVGPADDAPAHLGVRATSRRPEAASSRGWEHYEALEVCARTTWSPCPCRHPRTVLSTGPPRVSPTRAGRGCSPRRELRPGCPLAVKARFLPDYKTQLRCAPRARLPPPPSIAHRVVRRCH